jgi:hypothetical protein
LTAVRIGSGWPRLSVAFGNPLALEPRERPRRALFQHHQVVGYLVEWPPRRALYLFRIVSLAESTTSLSGVSDPVALLAVARTTRTIAKTRAALRYVARRTSAPAVDDLPDGFWLRLADFIDRRGYEIVPHVVALLEAQRIA